VGWVGGRGAGGIACMGAVVGARLGDGWDPDFACSRL